MASVMGRAMDKICRLVTCTCKLGMEEELLIKWAKIPYFAAVV